MSDFKCSLIFDEGTEDGIKVFRINKYEDECEEYQPIVVVRPTNITYINRGDPFYFSNIMSEPLSFFKRELKRASFDKIAEKISNKDQAYYYCERKAKEQALEIEKYNDGLELDFDFVNFEDLQDVIEYVSSQLEQIGYDDCDAWYSACAIDGKVMSPKFIDVVKDIASIAEFMENRNG